MRKSWPPLDILRALAVVLMLTNHLVVKFLEIQFTALGVTGFFNFIGSFAPVLFFLVTGIGFGHKAGVKADTMSVLNKATLLIIADVFMRKNGFTSFGWAFLAFIGFSMILLALIKGQEKAWLIALVLIISLFSLRYVLGSNLVLSELLFGYRNNDFLLGILGRQAFDNVSYWFTPWLIFPLFGFMIGMLINQLDSNHEICLMKTNINFFIACLTIGFVAAAVSFAFLVQGAILFRWGTMSINFFLASVSISLIAISTSFYLDRFFPKEGSFRTYFVMRGVSSLAAVPLHYFLLFVYAETYNKQLDDLSYFIALPIFITVVFVASKLVDTFSKSNLISESKLFTAISFTVVILCALVVIVTPEYQDGLKSSVSFVAEVTLCFILGAKYLTKKRSTHDIIYIKRLFRECF